MLPFQHPTTILVGGPTQCVKTHFVWKVLMHKMIQPEPERIIWVYGEWQDSFDRYRILFPNIEFMQNFTWETYNNLDRAKRNLVVLDDKMAEMADDPLLGDLFTKGSHHKNLTVMFLVQNVYHKGKYMRTASLNSHYIVAFKNARDTSQFGVLARQANQRKAKVLQRVFEEATSTPHGYLLMDFHPNSSDEYRTRTNIFPDEKVVVYEF